MAWQTLTMYEDGARVHVLSESQTPHDTAGCRTTRAYDTCRVFRFSTLKPAMCVWRLPLGRLLCRIFWGFKNGPFSQNAKKNIILCDSKRSSFITDFFFNSNLTRRPWIIPSFRTTHARGREQVANRDSNLIYLVLRNYLWYQVPDRIYMQYYYTVVQNVPQQQYS